MGNQIDKKYQALVLDILQNGEKKTDRTGTGTISVFGREIRHDMTEGFPLLTTKKMHFKSIRLELEWFLRGGTNIQPLVLSGCNIWNGDAYKNYLYNSHLSNPLSLKEFVTEISTNDEFAKKWGELGRIYGAQWRDWGGVDQITELIKGLKETPDSRRLIVSAWNVDELDDMVLPPCHNMFQCYTSSVKEKHLRKWAKDKGFEPNSVIEEFEFGAEMYGNFTLPKKAVSLKWNQRSVDTPLGLPFNIASYGLLLEMLADEVNYVADELIGSLGDTHIYLNQVEKVQTQLNRMSMKLPTILVKDGISSRGKDIQLLDYYSHETIKIPLSN
jgi:thymidylate synthase